MFGCSNLHTRHVKHPSCTVGYFGRTLTVRRSFRALGCLDRLCVRANRFKGTRRLLRHVVTLRPRLADACLALTGLYFVRRSCRRVTSTTRGTVTLRRKGTVTRCLLNGTGRKLSGKVVAVTRLAGTVILGSSFARTQLLHTRTLCGVRRFTRTVRSVRTVLTRGPSRRTTLLLHNGVGRTAKGRRRTRASCLRIARVGPFGRRTCLCLKRLFVARGGLATTVRLFSRTVRLGPGFKTTCRRQKHTGLLGKSGSNSVRSVGGSLRLGPGRKRGLGKRFGGRRTRAAPGMLKLWAGHSSAIVSQAKALLPPIQRVVGGKTVIRSTCAVSH